MLSTTTICVSLFILSIAWAATTTIDPEDAVTQSGSDNIRIVGGQDVTNRSYFAYQVSLRYNNDHVCGGSIIDHQHILTAAHCVVDEKDKALKASAFKAVVGDLYLKKSTTTVSKNVKYIFVHEKYNSDKIINDIAVLRIDSLGNFTKDINSVALASVKPADDTACVISGWGKLYEGATLQSNVLQYANVVTLNLATCNTSYDNDLPLGVLCAGRWYGGVDSCQGDSGGPLVCSNVQVGIVSFGYGCARYGFPGVYTDISNFGDWIRTQQARDRAAISLLSLSLIIISCISTRYL